MATLPQTRTHSKKFLRKTQTTSATSLVQNSTQSKKSAATPPSRLSYIGYSQTLDYLQGIKQPIGYLGDLYTQGSEEWVRLYIDYGDD
jgi:hypothetical protein